jgi:glycine/D-amino acid oxidase-like deaminating enzyme
MLPPQRVTHISPLPDASGLRVDTDRGTLTAPHVVLAAGSWAGHIDLAGVPAPVPVKPIRGQLCI